jgi:prepilin-type N-terminal cleavage/methylation domain-containing protein
MPVKRLREESGYSLVEVMVSIIILAIAIIPMVGMFDMGLNSATRGSNYDKARALANLKMEEAKSLPFANLRDNFPEAVGTPTTYNGSGYYKDQSDPPKTEPGFPNSMTYVIEKQYMDEPPKGTPADPADPSEDFATSPTATGLIRVTVTVEWPDGNTYTTFGLVAG